MSLQNASQHSKSDAKDKHFMEVEAPRIKNVLDKAVDRPLGMGVLRSQTRHLDEVRAEIKLTKKMSIAVEDSSDDLEYAVEGIMEKIENQIRRRKSKQLRKLRRRGKISQVFTRDFVVEQLGGHHAKSS